MQVCSVSSSGIYQENKKIKGFTEWYKIKFLEHETDVWLM